MNNFLYHVPTKIAFGKGQIHMLPELIQEYGHKVLLLYGGGSIKKIGIYDDAVNLMNQNNIDFIELSGVEPNPQVETVRKGASLCKIENIDVIVPIGGGSTIDCAKAIAVAAYYDGDPWEIVKDNSLITRSLPIVSVLTVAATGSEMDASSVISNDVIGDKAEIYSDLIYPKASILDPTYTFTVSKYHTAAGVADIMSHVFEYYFCGDKVLDVQRGMMNSVLKVCVKYGPIAVNEPDNEEARANLMWAASWAINGFIAGGAISSWPCHAMEYQLTNHYNTTHGHGMAIMEVAWMKHILNENTLSDFLEYGQEVFGIHGDNMVTAMKIIEQTKQFYESLGLSMTLQSIGAKEKSDIPEMAKQAVEEFGLDQAGAMSLTIKDVEWIYESCF